MPGPLDRVLPLVPLAASAGACTVDDTAPVIVDASFEDPSTLVVQFSEALGPIDEVVPEDHFRVASAFYIEDLGLTVYYDLAHHFPEGVPGVEGALAEAWFRHGFTLVTKISRGDSDDELRLQLSYPLEPYVCEVLPEASALGIPAGIHLHHARGSSPRITDEAGNELADLAPWWVKGTFSTTREGLFPDLGLDDRLTIDCPP